VTGRQATVAALTDVHKRFGPTHALRGIDFTVERGETVALLGANGAGKTTALSLLLGLRRPTSGTVLLLGRDPREAEARARIGSTPQESALPELLRVGEAVDLVRAHFDRPAARGPLLCRFGLDPLERRQCGGLSGGERRRLAVALAFAGEPELVLLDEPTTGLDLESRDRLWAAIRDFGSADGSVLLTTHSLDEAESLASRAVFLREGSVAAGGSIAALKEQAKAPSLEAAFRRLTGMPR
jgi:ABC-2 type transport system ATP-binding protein